MFSAVGIVQGDIGSLDDDLAAIGHGVLGVNHQVHDHLLELAGVSAGSSQPGGEPGAELDVFPNQRAQQPFHVRHDGVHVHHL